MEKKQDKNLVLNLGSCIFKYFLRGEREKHRNVEKPSRTCTYLKKTKPKSFWK
jgi:hypothetical protein